MRLSAANDAEPNVRSCRVEDGYARPTLPPIGLVVEESSRGESEVT